MTRMIAREDFIEFSRRESYEIIYNNLLFCYIVKHLQLYVPPVLVLWRRTTSQTGAFAIR
jgi:hypothetical protein